MTCGQARGDRAPAPELRICVPVPLGIALTAAALPATTLPVQWAHVLDAAMLCHAMCKAPSSRWPCPSCVPLYKTPSLHLVYPTPPPPPLICLATAVLYFLVVVAHYGQATSLPFLTRAQVTRKRRTMELLARPPYSPPLHRSVAAPEPCNCRDLVLVSSIPSPFSTHGTLLIPFHPCRTPPQLARTLPQVAVTTPPRDHR
jgi:hypothetical protein